MPQEFPPIQLMQILFGFAASWSIGFAAELRIADKLKGEAKSAEEFAKQTSTLARFLYRVLQAMILVPIVQADEVDVVT
jgi:hypothetical protein